MFRRAVVCWLGLVLVAGLLTAQPKPSSDLLLPYFEADLEDGEATTVFAVANALNKQVDFSVTVYTNWGSPALSFPVKLGAGGILSADLGLWLNEGKLPGRTMGAAELARLRARLSGQPSPEDNLYYSSEAVPGRATGYLVLRTAAGKTTKAKGGKTARPDALWGESFLVDPGQGAARGHDLIDVDPATRTGVCLRHDVRHLSGTGLDQARMILWRDLAGQILPTPVPADRRRHVDVAVYSADGTLVRNHRLQVLASDQVSLAELGLTEPRGRLEITSADPFVATVHVSENGPALEASCAQAGGPDKEPAVRIVTLANEEDANSPPGPKVPVGSTVTWQYRIGNTGAGALSQIKVDDNQGIDVKCPRNKLAAGESMICKATGPAEVCLHRNVGTVTATAAVKGKKKTTVTAQDPSHYTGDDGAAVRITVSTNGQDANDPEGPRLQSGSRVDWSYFVENTGRIRLYELKVKDDHNVAIDCPRVSLAPGEPMTCVADGIAVPGPYRNVGTVTASATCGPVSDDDVSHYFGESDTRLQLRALTNGVESDSPPGPAIPVGSSVTWEYVVTNTGKLDLHGLAVADDKGTAVTCPEASLKPGKSMTCIARGTAQPCIQSRFATATGKTSEGQPVAASDSTHYTGEGQAAIQVELSVNGSDADLPPGPSVVIGNPVQWSYAVSNLGKVALTGVQVTDDKGAKVTCPKKELQPGESMTCSASGIALSGAFSNLATATGTTPCGAAVSDDDASHYLGFGDPGIRIQTRTNGEDANVPSGPKVPIGSTVNWDYVVGNTGQVTLTGVLVKDSRSVGVTCPKTSLLAGQSMTCTGQGVARPCQYDNRGTVTAKTPSGDTASAEDPSHYFGQPDALVQIETAANGAEADAAPGPTIKVGEDVTWTYRVTNLGDVDLSAIEVTDDQGKAVACPRALLPSGETMTCKATGTAAEGQHRNVGTVSGAPPCGARVTAQDASHYFGGGDGALALRMLTNGEDVTAPPGPGIPLGAPVTWTYEIENTGLVSLSGVGVTDSRGVAVICPKSTLQPDEKITCTGAGRAQACQYDSFGIATGATPAGDKVSAVDSSYYLGKIDAGILIETRINSQDADTSPGPEIPVGSALTWSYAVTNTGDSILANVQVGDDRLGPVTCPKTTLQPGEQMTCFANGAAASGQYDSAGRVTADPACGSPVADDDGTHYFGGGNSGLQVRKLLNGQDAEWPGPEIPVGQQVSWSYVVTNSGLVPLSAVDVDDDDPAVVVSCPKTVLQPAESMTCTSNKRNARECQYVNVATATATVSGSVTVKAFDSSAYQGKFDAAIQIETTVNGKDADTAPGLFVAPDADLDWTYRITNPSTVKLTNVQVRDDQGASVDCAGKTEIAAGQFIVCTASGKAPAGQFHNTGIVTASPPCGALISAEDPSYAFGIDARIDIQAFTKGEDGPTVPPGSPITWTYIVQNPGNVAVSGIGVSDSKGVAVSCPKTALQPVESMTCTAQGTAQMCRYDNEGTVTGTADGGFPVTDKDASFYLVTSVSGIDVEMSIDADDADTSPGKPLLLGAPVTFTYTVRNTGQAALTNVTVTDDNGSQPNVTLTCNPPANSLAVGATLTCTAHATTVPGLYSATATVTANDACGTIQDVDKSYYNTPVFELKNTSTYHGGPIFLLSDLISLNPLEVDWWGFWRPNPDSGYHSLGDYYRADAANPPQDSVVTVRVKEYDDPNRPALKAPTSFSLVALTHADTLNNVYRTIWKANGPAGYVCTGHLFHEGPIASSPIGSPGIDRYRCLRQDLAVQVDIGPRVTPDSLDQDVTVFRIPKVNALHVVSPKASTPGEKAYIPYGLP